MKFYKEDFGNDFYHSIIKKKYTQKKLFFDRIKCMSSTKLCPSVKKILHNMNKTEVWCMQVCGSGHLWLNAEGKKTFLRDLLLKICVEI